MEKVLLQRLVMGMENVLLQRLATGMEKVLLQRLALTDQMCPDVAGLGVKPEDAAETSSEGRHRRPVSMQQKVIILQPIREHIVRYNTPPSLPNLLRERERERETDRDRDRETERERHSERETERERERERERHSERETEGQRERQKER
ncbi:hypothetical protein scyTo_0026425 [Scyliorhinus torazame]|uniref:Uncharacterized protein n=1 Tax=Scyliorhinus torazame TaxID=75743 RepID=A0A401QK74_SCYTO|nr:hypothetical protein [Scyliorhinus torazame]